MKKHRPLAPFAGLLLLGLALTTPSCALLDGNGEHTYEGFYNAGFEVSAFIPCGSEEAWWITFHGNSSAGQEFSDRYAQLIDEEYEPIYVRLRGVRSDKGAYGHLGGYAREFELLEVIEMRHRREDDCM